MEFVKGKGFRTKNDPQTIAKVCRSLEKDGKVIPKDLVDASRPEDAPLHNEFEWDDRIASEKYREVQAGYIIRSVRVKITSIPAEVTKLNVQITESKEPSVRVYHAIERDGNGYDSIENIVKNAEKEAKLMTQCIKDIRYFKEKYIVLRDAMPTLFDAIEKELQRMEVAS